MLGSGFEDYLVTYQADRLLFEEGESGDDFYIVKDGLLKVLKSTDGSGESAVVATIGPQETIGEMAMLGDSERRSASVRTETEVECWKFDREQFDKLMSQSSKFRDRVFGILSSRLKKTNEKLAKHEAMKHLVYQSAFFALHVHLNAKNTLSDSKTLRLDPSVKKLAHKLNIPPRQLKQFMSITGKDELNQLSPSEQDNLAEVSQALLSKVSDEFEFETPFEYKNFQVDEGTDFMNLDDAIQTAEQLLGLLDQSSRELSADLYESVMDQNRQLKDVLEDVSQSQEFEQSKIRRLRSFVKGISNKLQQAQS